MELKNKFYRHKNTLMLALASAIALFVTGCVYLDSINVMQVYDGKEVSYAYAGDEATFTMTGHIESASDVSNDRLVIAILAPTAWHVGDNATVTYKCDLAEDHEQLFTMSVVADTDVPKNGNGRTWKQCLSQTYGVGPNYLSDMEWVVFQTDRRWDIQNGDKPTYTVYIKTTVGTQNLRCHLGFFVNHTDDGFSDTESHRKVAYSPECFEVVGGNGSTLDFCNVHANRVTPASSLQNDYVTFSFLGDLIDNTLVGQDVYFEATAHTASGNTYVVNEKSAKTLMTRESNTNGSETSESGTYSITIWPAGFFNVPDGEEIEYIEYVFTNGDRSVIVGDEDGEVVTQDPFNFQLICQ